MPEKLNTASIQGWLKTREVIGMNEFKLTFTVTINEQDDPAARKQAKGIVDAVSKIVSDTDAKLQQVYPNKPPRGVRID
jgi:hypothetical protein